MQWRPSAAKHALAGQLGGRRRVSSYERLARQTLLEGFVEAFADEQQEAIAVSIRDADDKHKEYLSLQQQVCALPTPPTGAELHRVQTEGLAVARLHNQLASQPALDQAPGLRRACLRRALAAAPPAPLGSQVLAEVLYSLGAFHLQHSTPVKAIKFLRRSLEAAEPEPNATPTAISARLNLCVALSRTKDHVAALLEAQVTFHGLP